MKKVLKNIAVALLGAALLTVSFSAFAQEDNNRDAEGKVVRGPYLTNKFFDNWFIGIGGGVNTVYDNKTIGNIGIAVDANVGKWLTPTIGLRVGYHGIDDKAKASTGWFAGEDKFGFHFAHADVLWNLSNSFGGYKETRFWDLVPYVETGLIFAKYDGSTRHVLGVGAGLLNDFRLGKHVDLTLDLGAVAAPEKSFRNSGRVTLFPSATLGLVFNLGKSGFTRLSSVAPKAPATSFTEAQYLDLQNANRRLASQLGSRDQEIEKLKASLNSYKLNDNVTYLYKDGKFSEVKIAEAEAQPEIFYFDIGKSTLTERELARLEFYARNTFKKGQKLVVTGGADAGTGSAATNAKLSQKRADYVKGLLVKNYGFNAADIETKSEVLNASAPIKGRIVTIRVK